MAILALNTAATGLSALSTNIDIIAHNLANVNTNGFKSQRANFEDLLYIHKKQPGTENAEGDKSPAGLQVGLGTRISNTQYDFIQGSPIDTSRELDVMIDGKGFFKVQLSADEGGTGYTRAGNLFVNADGDLVLGNTDGRRIEPAIQIPDDAQSVQISSDGRVFAVTPAQPEPQEQGRLELANFVNPAGLKSIGGNIYVETAASGPPIDGVPREGGFGSVLQGFLEASNVDPVRELTELIKTQRAFEMNSQTIQAADETLQVVANMRRV
jgi:flagellar basal-body rod protein FlgG